MSELDNTLIAATSISTPAAGVSATFCETIDSRLKTKDSTGFVTSYKSSGSVVVQSPVAATRTYITGSQVPIGSQGLQVGSGANAQNGTRFRWRFNMTKTGAGVAASTIDIAIGINGTTADAAVLSFTKPAGTAVADEGFVEIDCNIRSIGATGTASAELTMTHNLSATGHMTQQVLVLNVVSGTFNTITPTFVGLCITTGAADAISIQTVQTESWNA
jgi:hypothetical protein